MRKKKILLGLMAACLLCGCGTKEMKSSYENLAKEGQKEAESDGKEASEEEKTLEIEKQPKEGQDTAAGEVLDEGENPEFEDRLVMGGRFEQENGWGESAFLEEDTTAFGEPLEELGVYDGYFEEAAEDMVVECVSGTENAYKLEGETLTFTQIREESVYKVSGTFCGTIVIDVGEEHCFELEFDEFSMKSSETNPITILSGDKVTLTAKKGSSNYIYDMRPAVDTTQDTLFSAAIYSEVDLKIAGKGALTVVSEHNKGIHTKDDLEVKNLTLSVVCVDNALKGNDSVTITGGTLTLIASEGDGIKTSNSSISKKGNQKGAVTIAGGVLTIYAACDGIDAAYNVVIEEDATILKIYTERYSNYSVRTEKEEEENEAEREKAQDVWEKETQEREQRNPEPPVTTKAGGFGGRPDGRFGGFGGMPEEGNTEKGENSTKGIRAENEIFIKGGTITIQSYDDAIHANQGTELENGEASVGAVTILGGDLTLYSKDDGIHADGTVTITDGIVRVINSYEGIEGATVVLAGGEVSVISSDDGINGTATSGTAIEISGGSVYIYCNGDGLDSNSTTSYGGIVFSGGTTRIISTSQRDSAIDTEQGYEYSGGSVLAIMPQNGMTQEIAHCSNFSEVSTAQKLSIKEGEYLTATIGDTAVTVQMPTALEAYVVVLGDNEATMTITDSMEAK